MIKVTISELEDIFKKISNDFKQLGIDEFEINQDGFWVLMPEYSREITLDIPNSLTEEMFSLGSVSDALSELRKSQNRQLSSSTNSLVWFAEVLKAIPDE